MSAYELWKIVKNNCNSKTIIESGDDVRLIKKRFKLEKEKLKSDEHLEIRRDGKIVNHYPPITRDCQNLAVL